MALLIITRQQGLQQYGITVQRDVEIGIFRSKRTLTLEAPMQFRGGQYDVGEIGAFTYLGQSFYRHVNKIGRFCALATEIQMGHMEHSVEMLSPHPMFVTKFDSNWREADILYEDMDAIRANSNFNNESLQRRTLIDIGNDVWIGHGVFISRGVKIGDGAIIAAKSVVTKDVPPYTVVGGVPARVIKQRFSDEVVEKLMKLQWWEYGPDILKGVHIYDIEETIDIIEARIAEGIPKYNPNKVEINLKEETITHISSTGERTAILG